ncbi:hypothetical protein [[Mycoplasma] collis]|uniref:hypothetical protein n=1 Tax=[Mycoplasma] collis TaxID=2127 RepID=UPI00051B8CC4|nr:hypothetical protein [[Mycoplasma] collis]
MNNYKIIISFVFLITGLLFFLSSVLLYFYRKKKNIVYKVNEDDKYAKQIYFTIVKFIPLIFFLIGIIMLVMLLKI